jgi:conjugative relaxase-like TrwC/TraI family protein
VLTIRAATSPGYYERAEFARDDYYAEAGAAPARWIGREAEALGLIGAPERGDLEALLRGRHPHDGEPLCRSQFRRTNAGFDLTFTAPKSMSVLAAVGEPAIHRAVIAAHEAGVAAGLDYLERHECQARRGAGGRRIIGAQGFAGVAYTHELSRASDPHLHTHVVIVNLVRGAEGRMSAPDMRPVFAAAKTAGTIAEAAARHELTRSLGVEWGPVQHGSAEIDGIPQEVLERFSTRWLEIAELAHARGASSLRRPGGDR